MDKVSAKKIIRHWHGGSPVGSRQILPIYRVYVQRLQI